MTILKNYIIVKSMPQNQGKMRLKPYYSIFFKNAYSNTIEI